MESRERFQELSDKWRDVLLVEDALEVTEHELLGTLRLVNLPLSPAPQNAPYRGTIQALIGHLPPQFQEMTRRLDERMTSLRMYYHWVEQTLKTRDPKFSGWSDHDEARLVGARALVQEAQSLRKEAERALGMLYRTIPESAWPKDS